MSEPDQVIVHTTDRIQFKRCRQRWDFSSNLRLNLEPKSFTEPLWFGSMMHTGLAAYYDPFKPERDIQRAIRTFNQAIDEWKNVKQDLFVEDVEKAEGLRIMGVGMLENYGLWAPKHDDFQVLFVELPMQVPIRVPGVSAEVRYGFKLDGFVVDEYERFWILEHKTAQQMPGDEIEWLMMDDQCGSYIWALDILGIPVEGVIYNTLKKKAPQHLRELVNGGLSVNKSQDTTFEVALADIKKMYTKVPKSYYDYLYFLRDEKPNNFFHRVPVRRNRRELQIMGESIIWEIQDMLENPRINRSPSRINCSSCPFVPPCLAKWDDSDHQFILDNMYQPREEEAWLKIASN